MDPLGREMHISLGCAIENLVLAGPPNGKAAAVTLLPDPADPTHIAQVDLVPTREPSSALFAAIPTRHTNRGAYDTAQPVTPPTLDAFGDLTTRATAAIIADPQQSADDFAWYRTDWDEIEAKKDGITIDPSGQSALIRSLAKVLPVSQKQNNDGWMSGTRETQIPTAAAFGALLVRDPLDPIQRLRAGRIWQRIQLSATLNGLGVQPLCQVPESIDREGSAGLEPDFTTALAAMLPAHRSPIMSFRTGYPTSDALRSPRWPAREVTLA